MSLDDLLYSSLMLPFEALWRCDGCGFEQIVPRDDPPATCPRCQHPSVFWVRSGSPSGKERP